MSTDATGAAGERVVALAPDLVDRSKVAAAVASAGRELVPVRSADALAGAVRAGDLVLVDLARPGAAEAIPAARAAGARRVVAFGSHVDREVLGAARAAGADEVLARSAFFGRVSEIASS